MEAIVIAIISAVSGIIVATITHFAQRPQRQQTKAALKVVTEQLENEHRDAPFPNTRDEITSVRETGERTAQAVTTLAAQQAAFQQQVGHLVTRLGITNDNVESLEDTLSSRDQFTDTALNRAIIKHDLDIKEVTYQIEGLNMRLCKVEANCTNPAINSPGIPVSLPDPSVAHNADAT